MSSRTNPRWVAPRRVLVAGCAALAPFCARALDVPEACTKVLDSSEQYRAVLSNARYGATSRIVVRNQDRMLENRIESSSIRVGGELFTASRVGQRTDASGDWQWAGGHRVFQSADRVAWSACGECPVSVVRLGRSDASDDSARSFTQSMSVDMLGKVCSAVLLGFSPASGESAMGLREGLERLESNGAEVVFRQEDPSAASIVIRMPGKTSTHVEMRDIGGFWVPGSALERSRDGTVIRSVSITYAKDAEFPVPQSVVEIRYSRTPAGRPGEKWRMETTFENVALLEDAAREGDLFTRFVPEGGTHAVVEEYDSMTSVPGVAPRHSYFLYPDGSEGPLTVIPVVEAGQ